MRPVILLIVSLILVTPGPGPRPASAAPGSSLEDLLTQRYALSRIEIENDRRQGAITKRGAVLILQEDGIPANELCVIRPLVHSPRSYIPNYARHLHNYARVEISPGDTRTDQKGALRLPRGTRLVVLGLRSEADRIRLLTHTVEPITVASGRGVYGCTEFVFHPERALLQSRDATAVQQLIERWLKPEAGGPAAHAAVVDARVEASTVSPVQP